MEQQPQEAVGAESLHEEASRLLWPGLVEDDLDLESDLDLDTLPL